MKNLVIGFKAFGEMPKILTHSSKEICLVEEICLCSHGFENAHKLVFFTPQLL